MDVVSPELMDFALVALDHAASSVISTGGPLTPFCLIQSEQQVEDGNRGQLTRFVCDLEEGQELARIKVKATVGIRRAAVAWDGYLTMDGIRTDAVFVEAFEAGARESAIVAQRYIAGDGAREAAHRIGEVAFVGRGVPLF